MNCVVRGDSVSAGTQEKLFYLRRRFGKTVQSRFHGSQGAFRQRHKSEVRAIQLQM